MRKNQIDHAYIEDLECKNCKKLIPDTWIYKEGVYLCKECFQHSQSVKNAPWYADSLKWRYRLDIPIKFMGESFVDDYTELADHKLSDSEQQTLLSSQIEILKQKGVVILGKGRVWLDKEPDTPEETNALDTMSCGGNSMNPFSLGNLTKSTPDKEAIARYCQEKREFLLLQFVHISADEYRASTNPGCWKFHSRSAEEGFVIYDCGPLDDQLRGYVYHDDQGNITRLDVVGE